MVSPIRFLFNRPYAMLCLPALAAAVMADPDSVRALGPYLGSKDVPIPDGSQMRVEGPEHFARTYAVIKPGMTGVGSHGYTAHTIAKHERINIPPVWLARPTLWLQVILANVLKDMKREQLVRDVWYAGERFARDMRADVSVVRARWGEDDLKNYFSKVQVVPQIGQGFWQTMDYGPIRKDLGGKRGHVNVDAVQATLERHLHPNLVRQYMGYRPR